MGRSLLSVAISLGVIAAGCGGLGTAAESSAGSGNGDGDAAEQTDTDAGGVEWDCTATPDVGAEAWGGECLPPNVTESVECLELEYCVPEVPEVLDGHVSGTLVCGNGGLDPCEPAPGQPRVFVALDGDLAIGFLFDPDLLAAYTTEDFSRSFLQMRVTLLLDPPVSTHVVCSVDAFDEFEYLDGRLRGVLEYSIGEAVAEVGPDDVNPFHCTWLNLSIPVRIEFDLAVEGL